jgi:2-dehydro-3-deoxygluconokinase
MRAHHPVESLPIILWNAQFAGDTLNTAWYLALLLGDRAEMVCFTAGGTDSVSDQIFDFLGAAAQLAARVGTHRGALAPV